MWVVPGVTTPGTRSKRPVDLMSVYPTLCAVTGIPKPDHVTGHDISPLLKNPKAKWAYPAITTHGRGNHAVRTETHRYIRYADGSEELYHNAEDPYEWKNLAGQPGTENLTRKLAAWLPEKEAPAGELQPKKKAPSKRNKNK